jgi:DNA-binding beta-propeller fold protein YncE
MLRLCSVGVAAALSTLMADVAGPVSGFVFDESARVIRPVRGIPGAATLGDPLVLGFEIASAAIAPELDYALAVATDKTVRIIRLDGRAAQPLETLHGAPTRITYSPRGTAVALLNESTIDVYTGLPDKPALARTLELSSVGSPNALALSDDGAAVLAAAQSSVFVAGESAEWRAIEKGRWVFAFAPGTRDAVLAGPGGAVHRVRDVAGSASRESIAPATEGAAAVSAIAFTPAGRLVVGKDQTILLIESSGELRGTFTCDCSPAALTRMGSVFRLGEVSEAPLWLLDGASGAGRLVFVPPAQRSKLPENE